MNRMLPKTQNSLISNKELMLKYAHEDCMLSFNLLFKEHNRNMIGYIMYQYGTTEDVAQDIVSQTWEKIIKSKASYKPIAKFRTYLYRILFNTHIDHYRKTRTVQLCSYSLIENSNDFAIDYPNKQFNDVLKYEVHLKLSRAIQSLPKQQAVVIKLHYLEGLKVKDIAQITDQSHECAKSRLRYAKKGIKKHLLKSGIDSSIIQYYITEAEDL